jgi:hypothetical protein
MSGLSPVVAMSSTLLDFVPVLAALVAVPLYAIAQLLALTRLTSGWRYAALLPLLLALTLAGSAFDGMTTGAGPTERTLLLFSPVAIIYLALLALFAAIVERLAGTPAAEDEPTALAAPPGSR